MRVLREISLAPEPVLHRFPELVEGNAGANFYFSIRYGKSVVEDAVVRETAHREGVEPFQRAGKSAAGVLILDADLACEHESDLTTKGISHGSARIFKDHKTFCFVSDPWKSVRSVA